MTSPADKQPQSFSDIFAHASAGVGSGLPGNETVQQLSKDVSAQLKLMDKLKALKQTRFINLVRHHDDGLIALSLYAGDGVVTKITRSSYTSHEALPYVLPAFKQHVMEYGRDNESSLTIENYPYLDTRDISMKDVEKMKGLLAECGLAFRNQDDRPGNIGRLPDGSLAVLDGGAVLPMQGADPDKLKRYAAAWAERVHANYPDLYTPDFQFTQSDNTSFALKSRAALAEAAPQSHDNKKPWYKRIMPANESRRLG